MSASRDKAPPKPAGKPEARKRRRARGPKRGALVLIAGLMAGSGLIRIGLGLQAAQALDKPAAAEHAPGPVAADCPAGAAGGGPVMPIVEALKEREARLTEREAAVAARAQALAVAGKAVDAKIAELKTAEEKLSARLALADGAAEADVAKLTAVYESMKPKEAAAVFEQMAPDFAAGFLGRMNAGAAAAILSGLSPEKAYTVSVILAGRNAKAPKN